MNPHAALLLAAILVVTACGADTGETTPTPGSASPQPASTAAPTGTPAPASTEAAPPPQATRPAATPTPEPTAEPPADPTPEAAPVTAYVVESGDTLGEIADRFDVTVEQLRAWNHDRYEELAASGDFIEVGWSLELTGPPDATLPPEPALTSPPQPAPTPTSGATVEPTPAATVQPTPEPAPDPTDPPAEALYVDDHCTVRDWLTPFRDYDRHHLTVLDWTYMVGPDYVPPDLASTATAGFMGVSGEKLVRQVAIADLAALRQAAAEAGHAIEIQSAYRSYETQAATFDHWVAQAGFNEAVRRSARPGHSEHQLGTTVDFTSSGVPPWQYGDWGATPAGAWMAENAWRFGWVLTLPAGATAQTCYDYEPWHFRWIGRDLAADWRASGLVFRDYQVRLGSGVTP